MWLCKKLTKQNKTKQNKTKVIKTPGDNLHCPSHADGLVSTDAVTVVTKNVSKQQSSNDGKTLFGPWLVVAETRWLEMSMSRCSC